MQVRFWGVRGSIAVSGERYVETGGNTTCVEVNHEGERLILDAGTGLRELGEELEGAPLRATLLFTHVHWDHIQGFPFFNPAYHPASQLELFGTTRPSGSLRDALQSQMSPPTFPITLSAMSSQMHFVELPMEEVFERGPFRIQAIDMQHPDGVVSFRIEAGGKSVVFATDVEHGGKIDPRLVQFCQEADLLIHDAQYSTKEYLGENGPPRVGWGHSTWDEALEVAERSGSRQLALFHHDPMRSDHQVRRIEAWAKQRMEKSFAAREGTTIDL